MKVTCFGPRGSLPSPSTPEFSTVEFGGNTSCYYVEAGPFRIILDCGSGVKNLGDDLMKTGQGFNGTYIVLLSHYHWDHIQGLPFCVPMFIGNNEFHFHGFRPSGHEGGPEPVVEEMLGSQQAPPHFPVAHQSMPSQKTYTDHARQFPETFWYWNIRGIKQSLCGSEPPQPSEPTENDERIKITTIPLNHPDGCLGYRIEYGDKVVVYCTDNEPLRHPNAQITKHGQDANLIILDGQYTEEELGSGKQTFGHGTPGACVEQALVCGAKSLWIHHHDPNRNDDTLVVMEESARSFALRETDQNLDVRFAREGRTWER